MDTFAKRLCDTLEKKNMRPSDLAELTGIGKSAISQYMKGAFRPKQVRTEKIASALGVSVAFLMGWSDDPQPITENRHIEPVYPFPIIGDVAAGYDCPAIEEYTGEYEHIPAAWLSGRSRDDFFVLRVKGDSMYPDYQDGDRVLVQRQDIVESGAIAVVIYDSENATLKKVKYYREKNYMELIPLNREYAPKRIEKADLNQCRILSEVRRLIRVVKREE